jgi:hypothetical protein
LWRFVRCEMAARGSTNIFTGLRDEGACWTLQRSWVQLDWCMSWNSWMEHFWYSRLDLILHVGIQQEPACLKQLSFEKSRILIHTDGFPNPLTADVWVEWLLNGYDGPSENKSKGSFQEISRVTLE